MQMSVNNSQSGPAQRYLGELERALASTPTVLRREILTDVAAELRGLDEEAVKARITELGDPRAIAADVSEAQRQETQQVPSKVYPTVTAVVLTAGWYLVPLIGWVAGLVMIGAGAHWDLPVRRKSILVSVVAALVAFAALLAFRSTEFWPVGLTIFLLVPLITNIFISAHLRQKWSERHHHSFAPGR